MRTCPLWTKYTLLAREPGSCRTVPAGTTCRRPPSIGSLRNCSTDETTPLNEFESIIQILRHDIHGTADMAQAASGGSPQELVGCGHLTLTKSNYATHP